MKKHTNTSESSLDGNRSKDKQFQNQFKKTFEGFFKPVSYTHLDVYKRQIIYLFFAEFRKSEFVNVLKDRISTISNYFNEDEAIVDESKMINDTPTYSIHQEEIEVFNEKFEPIFSNITGKKNIWNEGDLLALKNTGSVYRRDTKAEIYGEKIGGRYFLIASEDFMGCLLYTSRCV